MMSSSVKCHLILILLLHYLVKRRSRRLAVYNNDFILGNTCVGSEMLTKYIATNTISSSLLLLSVDSATMPNNMKWWTGQKIAQWVVRRVRCTWIHQSLHQSSDLRGTLRGVQTVAEDDAVEKRCIGITRCNINLGSVSHNTVTTMTVTTGSTTFF